MDICTFGLSVVGFLKGVSVVAVRIRLGGDKGSGSVLSGGSFEGDSDGNLESVGPGEVDPLVVSYGA